jgi:16S rRNA (guanine1207-N2)-methyltransferase
MSRVTDKSISLLLQHYAQCIGQWLIIADENWQASDWITAGSNSQRHSTAITNRLEIARGAEAANIVCQFNDFDFSAYSENSFDGILYRVSKERASSHHIINQSLKLLKPNGKLVLSGEKNDGIKSYVKQAAKLFGNPVNSEKHGKAYIASIELIAQQAEPLNDKNYAALRQVKLADNLSLSSKPGIFGWDKIDRGSAFLVDHLPEFLKGYKNAPQSLLDLGCGYGYLAISANQFGFHRIMATDNNAAALLAVKENFQCLEKIECGALATDAGDKIEETFDTILCNPPFHSGFSVDDQLAVKFLSQTKRLLKHSGQALFVVNTFIPLEHKAKSLFGQVEVMANNGSFKLIRLKH